MRHPLLPHLTGALILAASQIAGPATAQTRPAPSTPPPASTPVDSGAAFLAANAKAPGVRTTASGLQYKVLQSGPVGGASPKLGDEVQVAYQGRLLNGTVFDSATDDNPAALQVGELVPGWNEALQLMKPGDEWELYVPPTLGYGDEAKGPIPGGSTMIFRMKLLAVGPIQ